MTAPFRFPRFYVTSPSPCPYLPGRQERKVFTELNGPHASELNDALGRIGEPASLPEKLREREQPNGRRPLAEIALEAGFKR